MLDWFIFRFGFITEVNSGFLITDTIQVILYVKEQYFLSKIFITPIQFSSLFIVIGLPEFAIQRVHFRNQPTLQEQWTISSKERRLPTP